MKNLLFILFLCAITNLHSQSWGFKSGGNAFDGKYRTAYVQGSGTDFPYNKPLLTINLFNDDLLNFYITSAGYFQSEILPTLSYYPWSKWQIPPVLHP